MACGTNHAYQLIQGVPLLIQVELTLIPHNDIVYQIPVDEWSYDPTNTDTEALPVTGTGCITVNHDYPTDESMTYVTGDCCAIEGANIWVFTKVDWDNGARSLAHAVATSITTTGGRWAYAVMLDPGDYVVRLELPGRYGPDTVSLTVTGVEVESSSVLASESAAETIENSYGMF